MAQADLDRVREDLVTMKRAAGVGIPLGREDVLLSLAWVCAGVPVAVWTAFAPTAPWVLGVLLGVPAVGVMLLTASVSSRYHREKAPSPMRWREHRHQWILAALAIPLAGGFWLWGIRAGLSVEALTAATVFMAGLGYLVPPVVDRRRLFYLGWAVPTMLLGVVGLLSGRRYLGVAVGGWLIASGLSAAAIMAWQLRAWADDRGPD